MRECRAPRRSVARVALVAVVLVVASAGVVALPAAGAAGAAATATTPDDPSLVAAQSAADETTYDAVIEDGGTYFVGQVLFTDVFDPGDRVELRRSEGGFVSDVVLSDNGTLTLDTERYGPGEYRLVDQSGTSISFTVATQTFDATAANERVLNGGDESRTSLAVTSNRANYTYLVFSGKLSATELASVLGAGRLEDFDGDGDAELVVRNARPVESFKADFTGVSPGEYDLQFVVPDTRVTDTVSVEVGLFPDGIAIVTDEEPLRVQQAAGRQLTGRSTLPDGTRLTVTVENVSGPAFRLSERVTVRDGRFVATFDFSGLPTGQRFTVTVEQGPVVRDRVTGEVVPRARVSPDASATYEALTLDSVTLPDGGYVVVTTLDGKRVVASDRLSPGSYQGLTLTFEETPPLGEQEFVVTLRRDDGDGVLDDGDPPYRLQGAAVSRVVSVTVPTPRTQTTTATVTATPTRQSTPTATPTPTTTPAAADGATDGGAGAGFSFAAVFVGIVVLVLVLLILFGPGRDGDGGE